MIKTLIGLIALFALTVVTITYFLSPNSLLSCSDTPSELDGCEPADAIIVVSGGDTPARTQQAIQLYQNGWADRLIMSGAAYDKSGPSNAEVMRDQAIAQGVPSEAISIEAASETTKQNAEKTKTILDRRDISSAIIVTSSYHAKRTLLEFRTQSPDVTYRIKPTQSDRQWSVWWWTTPYGWYLALSELAKIAIFYLGGSR